MDGSGALRRLAVLKGHLPKNLLVHHTSLNVVSSGVQDQKRKVAIVVGVGPGIGSSIARKFAKEGFNVIVTRRTKEPLFALCKEIEQAGGEAHPYPLDARKEDQVKRLFEEVENQYGPVEVAIFNVGAWYNESILTLSSTKFLKIWEMACFGGFLVGREAAQRMTPRGRGTILFTGATAATRGASGFAAFSSAKSGLRALAQSMARELGPKGIHVAHVVVDGPVDSEFIRERFGLKDAPEDALLSPDSIAESFYHIYTQSKNAWTHELDLRPYSEKW